MIYSKLKKQNAIHLSSKVLFSISVALASQVSIAASSEPVDRGNNAIAPSCESLFLGNGAMQGVGKSLQQELDFISEQQKSDHKQEDQQSQSTTHHVENLVGFGEGSRDLIADSPDLMKRIDNLIDLQIKIQKRDFANDDQRLQALSFFERETQGLDATYIDFRNEYRQRFFELQKINAQKNKIADSKKIEDERQRRKIENEQIRHVIDGTHVVMHRIEPGSFKMGEVGKQIDVTITKPFDMMATPTTQIIWKKIADLAAQKFTGKYQINADPSQFKGDTRPVEQVAYVEIQEWIEALNELSAAGEPALADLIPGHKKGDVYRLPTEAEWEFVARMCGLAHGDYSHGNTDSNLGEYAWYSSNSNGTTHPVGQKKPIIINGKPIYDMHGNVWEWVADAWGNLTGGIDPLAVGRSSSTRVIRGGSWNNNAQALRSGNRSNNGPGIRYSLLGFRLVRNAR